MDKMDIHLVKWIIKMDKDLLYSTGKTAQYSTTNLLGKECEKRIDIGIGVTKSLCYTPETNTTLLINYTLI